MSLTYLFSVLAIFAGSFIAFVVGYEVGKDDGRKQEWIRLRGCLTTFAPPTEAAEYGNKKEK